MLVLYGSGNDDERRFECPRTFDASRGNVGNHVAFGVGIHRCIGSNLARMELRIALEEWMKRYPDFELVDPMLVTWSAGQVRGPRTIPVQIL